MNILKSLPGPVALVCGYGERNAAAGAGMLATLNQTGWRPDIVVGSSMGALTAAAAIVDADQAGNLATMLWSQVAMSKMVDPSWTRIAAATRGSESAKVNRAWRELLVRVLGDAQFPADGAHALVGTNLTDGTPELLTTGSLTDAVVAAAAFPIFVNPAVIDGDIVVDGGFVAPLPVLQAMWRGAKSIVVLQTGRPVYADQPLAPTRWYEVVLASVRSQLGATASHDVATAATQVPVLVLETPRPAAVRWSDVSERITAGARDTEQQLSELNRQFPHGITGPGVYATATEVTKDLRLSQVIVHSAEQGGHMIEPG